MSRMIMEIDEMVPLFKLLGDRTRLTIVHLLQIRECCVCELVDVLRLSQPVISIYADYEVRELSVKNGVINGFIIL